MSAFKDEEYLFKSIGLNVISYFVKPLEVKNMMEILKKVKTKVLEEQSKDEAQKEIVELNDTYLFNLKTNMLSNKQGNVNLSKKETLLIQALVKNIKEIKTKEFIWNDSKTSDANICTVIKRVKDKIKDDDFIVSKKGLGISFRNILTLFLFYLERKFYFVTIL